MVALYNDRNKLWKCIFTALILEKGDPTGKEKEKISDQDGTWALTFGLGPIYTVQFLSHATTAYDRPTTWFTIVVYVRKNVVAF